MYYYFEVTGPCIFLVIYDSQIMSWNTYQVTGPCIFLVIYDTRQYKDILSLVTGPCIFLVIYDTYYKSGATAELQDPVYF